MCIINIIPAFHIKGNTKKLKIRTTQVTNNSVTIEWENFRRNLTLTSHLLNYEIHYKEAIGYPNKTVSKFEDRDPCGDDGWNINDKAKISDNDVKGIENEPEWENEALVINLKPFTWYALYVKAIVIPDENSLNNNTGAESDLMFFRTYAHIPSKPRDLKLGVKGPSSLSLAWEAPLHPNGIMSNFQIWIREVPETQSVQDQRDYCSQGRSEITGSGKSFMNSAQTFKDMILPSKPSTTVAPMSSDPNCCACAAPGASGTPTTGGKGSISQKIQDVLDEDAVFEAILKHVLYTEPGHKNDPSCNEVRKSGPQGRRRRRSLDEENRTSSSQEVMDERIHVFPDNQIVSDAIGGRPVDEDMFMMYASEDEKPNRTLAYNSTTQSYVLVVEGLKHYTVYQVGIQACREPDPDIKGNDTRTCSKPQLDRVQTEAAPEADYLDMSKIKIYRNETDGNRLRMAWAEPRFPNGVVMAYTIRVQRVGSTKEEPPQFACVTHKEFVKKGRNFTFPQTFHPGNYSVKIQVHSLARDSEFTVDQYFFVEDLNGHGVGFWVMVILFPILFFVVILLCFLYVYVLRKGGIVFGPPRITSVNPEYMPNGEIHNHSYRTRIRDFLNNIIELCTNVMVRFLQWTYQRSGKF
jgi:hypothetical protein